LQTSDQPVLRDIVLIGGGHSHVGVLKSFGMRPIPGVRLTLVCTDSHTPYSGMLPGYVAGHYGYDDVHIDLRRLAQFANARMYRDEVIGIDRVNKKVLCRNRPPVPYDILSINIGSTPQVKVAGASDAVVPVKPIAQFNQRWLDLLARVKTETSQLSIAVVGAGAGGVELTLAMQYRLNAELKAQGRSQHNPQFHLFSATPNILPTHNDRVRDSYSRFLKERGVIVHTNAAVENIELGETSGAGHKTPRKTLRSSDASQVLADEVMWVTRAGGADWLKQTGLDLDEDGFIKVNDNLQATNDPLIFAAGDGASMINFKLEKAGVFAVRQGKPLTENLRRSVAGSPMQAYRPQTSWLALISTGDQYAVASRGALSFQGRWVWRWKDWIDRRFMAKFSEFPAMSETASAPASQTLTSQVQLNAEESKQAISAIAMRCGGCGAKVGSTVLSRALGNLKPIQREDVLIGLHDPDDAAVVRIPPGKLLVHSVDFFRAFIDDPYIFGQVAANHSLGDIWAMGAIAQSATAVATVPPGLEAKVEDVLFQMMSGALSVLNEANCSLVGGHTGEGKELALGFAVNGLMDDGAPAMVKGGMRPGDALILTKPIGTGTLFAAYPQLKAKGRWIDAALESMVRSNRDGAQILREFGVRAATDLTGFGLLGHLVEMTRPSGVDAQLQLSALPILDGAEELVAQGIVSSLQPANVRLRRAIRNQEAFVNHPRYPLIFDPQTAGGLLASVPADQVDACVAKLRANGYPHTAIIGKILGEGQAIEPISLVE
jgi:selenide, water dikinase